MHLDKWVTLFPVIQDICNISGIPGVSLGVVENNEFYTASFGYADIASKTPCDSDTTYVLGSLSKGVTAALVSSLHDDGTIPSWDTPLESLLPEFHREDIYGEITLIDLLTHRTGLAALDSLWLASNNDPYLPRSEAIPLLNHAPGIQPFRTRFIYNNFGYEILGQVIEKVTGASFAEVLRRRLLDPLKMRHTYYTGETREHEAKPYAALENRSMVSVPPPLYGKDVLMGPAGGIRSSVNDLLILYKAFMSAERGLANLTKPVIRDIQQLWRGHQNIPFPSLREHSYGFGWARAQLPAQLSRGPDPLRPIVGVGVPSQLALFHGGAITGYNTYTVLLPEIESAAVVLTNSQSLNGGVELIGELLVEMLLNNSHNAADYRSLAKLLADATLQQEMDINKSLVAGRTAKKPSKPLDAYIGKYVNAAGNFVIQIGYTKDKKSLQVSYMGRNADAFRLVPYQKDSFYWILTHDESATLAREFIFPAEYHIIKFGSQHGGPNVSCLWWKHDADLPAPGELFVKTTKGDYEYAREEL
ncbi:beta-lactamase/transpeptidase-like protein [Penicillium maclennaniae]|uniref:beta-lactamase/transpeptidase-like protein n=1 Tax=Penicillium maclennaniae TaxID=1343394 RepID=UPI002541D581|nr:beta-lactamase/transpeptidase-like protein [Penicillium maclennaniae]KAJ5665662.1 beta-lactamase/transpeptidase-like protein [Penicillium maclennaniae]